ncbi:MAG: hypothetical protein EOO42_10630 [Flavobacteriales bacterium]|nr:MAG: hypothetical protein EOO42_10630 [Flavobacteriales bacterium]
MEGKLQQPQTLWKLIMMQSVSEIEGYLDQLQFDYMQKLVNGLLYSSFGEALMIEMQHGKPRMITYKTNREIDCAFCIDYAKHALQYVTVMEERDDREHVLRLDGEVLTLFCHTVVPSATTIFSMRLLFTSSLTKDKVTVTISPL